jgi:hypothetical protein
VSNRLIQHDFSVAQILRLMHELEPKVAGDFVKCLRSCPRGSALQAFDRDEQTREGERTLLRADAILSAAEEVTRERELGAKSNETAAVGGRKD